MSTSIAVYKFISAMILIGGTSVIKDGSLIINLLSFRTDMSG